LTQGTVVNLVAAAGLISGIGDWRPQKGKGTYGQYQIVGPKDRTHARLVKNYGREGQEPFLFNPACYDDETEKLWQWFQDEAKIREVDISTAAG